MLVFGRMCPTGQVQICSRRRNSSQTTSVGATRSFMQMIMCVRLATFVLIHMCEFMKKHQVPVRWFSLSTRDIKWNARGSLNKHRFYWCFFFAVVEINHDTQVIFTKPIVQSDPSDGPFGLLRQGFAKWGDAAVCFIWPVSTLDEQTHYYF